LIVDRPEAKFNRIVGLISQRLAGTFFALGDSTRHRMRHDVALKVSTAGQLAKPFSISLFATSKHIAALESAGLICREARGTTRVCRPDPCPFSCYMYS